MSERKILYSPGFGAGWSSWSSGDLAKLMIDYKPFIDHIESGGSFPEGNTYGIIARKEDGNTPNFDKMKETMQPVLYDFCVLCQEKFDHIPYLGGLRDVRVLQVRGKVRINEYDGSESVEEQGDFDDWL